VGTQGLKVPLGVMPWGTPINPKSPWWGHCKVQAREKEEEEEEEESERAKKGGKKGKVSAFCGAEPAALEAWGGELEPDSWSGGVQISILQPLGDAWFCRDV